MDGRKIVPCTRMFLQRVDGEMLLAELSRWRRGSCASSCASVESRLPTDGRLTSWPRKAELFASAFPWVWRYHLHTSFSKSDGGRAGYENDGESACTYGNPCDRQLLLMDFCSQ